jgi:outer membrane protein
MMRRSIKLLLGFLSFSSINAQTIQPEKWDIRKCVEYALKNNISVKQADLQARFAQLDLHLSKMALYPFASFSGNVGYSSGRNQDPTTFSLITNGYFFNDYRLQAGADLFNWFSKKNTIAARDYNLQSTVLGAEKARNDLSLNIAASFLQVLLAKEQVRIAEVQMNQTRTQLERTRIQVNAGSLPELSAAQLEAQLATDSAAVINAETTTNLLFLQMKALLNLDAAAPFDIETPSIDQIPVDAIADLQPDAVYAIATASQPQQKADGLNIKAAQKLVEAARGSMYPTISLFGNLGTTFNSRAREVKSRTQGNIPVGTVSVNGTPYQVFPINPIDIYSYGNISYFDQVNRNFRQAVGVAVSVPIFNGHNLKGSWMRSKLNLKQLELQKEQNSQTLKQDIYKAYNEATAALQQYQANKKTAETAQKAYDFAKKRYDLNLLSIYDLINSRNSFQTARIQTLYAQYDYVFKMKVLEFYKGQGIKL